MSAAASNVDNNDSSSDTNTDPSILSWWRVGHEREISEGGRLHVEVNGRFVTIFRHKGELSCIDAVCHHAGGPLTTGAVKDIEDLGRTVVSCPWHKFMVCIHTGLKVYQGVEVPPGGIGAPIPTGWKLGKVVQRAHRVSVGDENGPGATCKSSSSGSGDGVLYVSLDEHPDEVPSDKDTCKAACMREYPLHAPATPA